MLQTAFKLSSDQCKPHLIAALRHRGKEARMNAALFLAKCTMYPSRKRQVANLCRDRGLGPRLGKLAMSDKEKVVKLAGCKAMHGLHEMGIMKGKKVNKDLLNQYEQLLTNRRVKKNLETAVKEYAREKSTVLKSMVVNSMVSAEKDQKEKPRIIVVEGMYFLSFSCTFLLHQIDRARHCLYHVVDDEKILEKPQDQVTNPHHAIRKGPGGKLEPHGIWKTKHKCQKPHQVEQKSLECNKKALDAAKKFKACNKKLMLKKLHDWVKNDVEWLDIRTKITERVYVLEEISKDLKQIPRSKWSKIYDAIICLAQECMGWNGRDARNPCLVKVFLGLISTAMANGKIDDKNTGIFSIYLVWTMQRLQESKFNHLATQCLLNTCYQFSPKVVFSKIEQILLSPDYRDPYCQDHFMIGMYNI